MDLTLRLNTGEFESAIRQVGDKAPAIVTRALNRSIRSARTLMARAIAQDMGLQVGRVRDRHLSIQEASYSRPVARLSASLKRVPLIEFSARGPEPSRGKGRGVRARLKGGAGRYPHAFIATMRSGHRGVFERAGKARLPIIQKYGPSVGLVFLKHLPRAQARFAEQLSKNMAHEFRFVLSKLAR